MRPSPWPQSGTQTWSFNNLRTSQNLQKRGSTREAPGHHQQQCEGAVEARDKGPAPLRRTLTLTVIWMHTSCTRISSSWFKLLKRSQRRLCSMLQSYVMTVLDWARENNTQTLNCASKLSLIIVRMPTILLASMETSMCTCFLAANHKTQIQQYASVCQYIININKL